MTVRAITESVQVLEQQSIDNRILDLLENQGTQILTIWTKASQTLGALGYS